MDRQQAIQRAVVVRRGNHTVDCVEGAKQHESINAAKRYVSSITDGKKNICVVERPGENLLSMMHKRIAQNREKQS